MIAKYKDLNHVPLAEALAGLARQYPDAATRNQLIAKVTDVPEMSQDLPLVELKTEDEVFAAGELERMESNEVQILPTGRRYYPYRQAAAQTIGWVGPATQPRDLNVFADDPLASYLKGEVCGREDGVEYACESLLRGRRGEIVYDIDRQLVRQTDTEFGQDVQLTLDIRLQKQIEQRLMDPEVNPDYARAPMAAVGYRRPLGRHPGPGVAAQLRFELYPAGLQQASGRSQPADDQSRDLPALPPGVRGQARGPHRRPGVPCHHAGGAHLLSGGGAAHGLAQVLDLPPVQDRSRSIVDQ